MERTPQQGDTDTHTHTHTQTHTDKLIRDTLYKIEWERKAQQ